jgi:uncharacterized membrane protein
MKKTASQIITIIGAIIAIIGIVIDAFSTGAPVVAFSIVDLSAIVAVFAIAFIFGKNKDKAYIGYLLALILGLSALTTILLSPAFSLSSLGFVVMAIASIVYFFIKFIKMLGFEKVEKKDE